MTTTNDGDAKRAFRECYFRIRCNSSAERLWNRYLSDEDREQLGDDLAAVYRARGTVGMWAVLKGVSLARAVLEVGHRLNFLTKADFEWLLHAIGEFVDPEDAMAAAVAAGDLVLAEEPRAAHWRGETIRIDWYRFGAHWQFLWELCRHAKQGHHIDPLTFDCTPRKGLVAKRKHRLTTMPGFPVSLTDAMVSAGQGTQTLDFPRERIRIFERSDSGVLSEWQP